MAEKLEVIITAIDKGASGVLRGIGGIASGMLTAGLAVGAAAFGGLAAGIGFSIREAMEAQEVFAQTEAVIKSTGGVAGITAQAASDMAEGLSEVTRFSDEMILSGENLLLTFTNISSDIFPDATEVMLDMSQALGQDLKSSAVQLGKALQDPILGVTALRRVGVNFNEEQQKVIENLVKTGKLEEAQAMILRELQTEFGGSAKAAGETFAGKLDILRNRLSNVGESIGMALLPLGQELLEKFIVPAIPLIESMAETFLGWVEIFTSARTPLEGFRWLLLDIFGPDVLAGFDFLVAKFTLIKDTIMTFVNTTLIPFIQTHWAELKAALIAVGIVLAGAGIVAGIVAIGGVIATLFSPIGLIVGAVALLGAAWAGNWGGIQEKTAAVINFLKPLIQGFIAGIQAWWAEHGAAIIATAQMIWDSIKAGFDFFVGIFKGVFAAFSAAFQGDWRKFGEELRKVWDTLWAAIKKIVETAITNIKNTFKNTDWKAVGKNIIQGIANGITAALSIIKNAALAAAKAAWEAAKGFLGIDSPSKLFAGIGENMMTGMAGGITGAARAPIGAVTQAAQGAVRGATRASGAGFGGPVFLDISIFAAPGQDENAIAVKVARLVLNSMGRSGSIGFAG